MGGADPTTFFYEFANYSFANVDVFARVWTDDHGVIHETKPTTLKPGAPAVAEVQNTTWLFPGAHKVRVELVVRSNPHYVQGSHGGPELIWDTAVAATDEAMITVLQGTLDTIGLGKAGPPWAEPGEDPFSPSMDFAIQFLMTDRAAVPRQITALKSAILSALENVGIATNTIDLRSDLANNNKVTLAGWFAPPASPGIADREAAFRSLNLYPDTPPTAFGLWFSAGGLFRLLRAFLPRLTKRLPSFVRTVGFVLRAPDIVTTYGVAYIGIENKEMLVDAFFDEIIYIADEIISTEIVEDATTQPTLLNYTTHTPQTLQYFRGAPWSFFPDRPNGLATLLAASLPRFVLTDDKFKLLLDYQTAQVFENKPKDNPDQVGGVWFTGAVTFHDRRPSVKITAPSQPDPDGFPFFPPAQTQVWTWPGGRTYAYYSADVYDLRPANATFAWVIQGVTAGGYSPLIEGASEQTIKLIFEPSFATSFSFSLSVKVEENTFSGVVLSSFAFLTVTVETG